MPLRRVGQVVAVPAVCLLSLLLLSAPAGAQVVAEGDLVFSSNRVDVLGSNSEIFRMNQDGSAETRLTNSPANDVDPVWSPDATKIAFVRIGVVRGQKVAPGQIWLMNADGSGQRRLTRGTAKADASPVFSPDGTTIAFTRNRVAKGNSAVFAMNADGTNERRLTSAPGFEGFPAYSPDGSQIVYTSDQDGQPELYKMNADGTAQTRLTNNGAVDMHAEWSPDGSRIAFLSDRLGTFQVFVMPASGGTPRLVTTGVDDEDTASGDYTPKWSPDGRRIAFTASHDESFEIVVIDAAGGTPAPLTAAAGSDFGGDWHHPPGTPAAIPAAVRRTAPAPPPGDSWSGVPSSVALLCQI